MVLSTFLDGEWIDLVGRILQGHFAGAGCDRVPDGGERGVERHICVCPDEARFLERALGELVVCVTVHMVYRPAEDLSAYGSEHVICLALAQPRLRYLRRTEPMRCDSVTMRASGR